MFRHGVSDEFIVNFGKVWFAMVSDNAGNSVLVSDTRALNFLADGDSLDDDDMVQDDDIKDENLFVINEVVDARLRRLSTTNQFKMAEIFCEHLMYVWDGKGVASHACLQFVKEHLGLEWEFLNAEGSTEGVSHAEG